ncbi:hypothetical protein [Bartonella sp. AD13SXNS]
MQGGLLNRCWTFEAFAFVGHISVLFLVLRGGGDDTVWAADG